MTTAQTLAVTKLIRLLLQAGAGALVSKGVGMPDADWDLVAGLLIAAASYAWSLIEGRLTQKVPTIPVKTDEK